MTEITIVGAGLFGLTMAQRCAVTGFDVTVIDQRGHIGGNAYSYIDGETGIEVHPYGTHVFHTSNHRVWDYVNQFTQFYPYRHKVMAMAGGDYYPMPVNLTTICDVAGLAMTPDEARGWINRDSTPYIGHGDQISLEDKAMSMVGKRIYDLLIKNYTKKQWQTDPRDLPADIINRLPVKYDFDPHYFNDTWEGIPYRGYTAWFESMVHHPRITMLLNTEWSSVASSVAGQIPVVYTGPLDQYFKYSNGHLGWRSVDFTIERRETSDHQGIAVMNYPDLTVPYTRVHEFKHLRPDLRHQTWSGDDVTIISYEHPVGVSDDVEPYYPINAVSDRQMLAEYRALAHAEASRGVFFGGRLGTYKYLDMHMAVASALTMAENTVIPHLKGRSS